jgi:hypothetical protein
MVKLKILLFGESQKLKRIELTESQKQDWSIIAEKKKITITEAILDPFFYHALNDQKIKSLDDLDGEYVEGLLNTNRNQIEIWLDRKKAQKLKVNDLIDELLLFPLYKTELRTKKMNESGIYAVRKDVGLIAQYETYIQKFDINNLKFKLILVDDILLIEGIVYEDGELEITKKDTVTTQQYVYEM